jgi:hypothetical protein
MRGYARGLDVVDNVGAGRGVGTGGVGLEVDVMCVYFVVAGLWVGSGAREIDGACRVPVACQTR